MREQAVMNTQHLQILSPEASDTTLPISTQVSDCFQSSDISYELRGTVDSELELGRMRHAAFSMSARSSEHTLHTSVSGQTVMGAFTE